MSMPRIKFLRFNAYAHYVILAQTHLHLQANINLHDLTSPEVSKVQESSL